MALWAVPSCSGRLPEPCVLPRPAAGDGESYFLNAGHRLSDSGRKASAAGIVATKV